MQTSKARDPRIEIPACAALRFAEGMIVAGNRHDVCITSARTFVTPNEMASATQGFMTTAGRFVDREEGWRLAIEAGIVIDRPGVKILFSEDLY